MLVRRVGFVAKTNDIRIIDAGIASASVPYIRTGASYRASALQLSQANPRGNLPRHERARIPLSHAVSAVTKFTLTGG